MTNVGRKDDFAYRGGGVLIQPHAWQGYNSARSEEVLVSSNSSKAGSFPAPLQFRLAVPSVRWPLSRGVGIFQSEGNANEHRYREVVQRLQRLRLHQTRRRRRGPLRPFLRDPGFGLQDPE